MKRRRAIDPTAYVILMTIFTVANGLHCDTSVAENDDVSVSKEKILIKCLLDRYAKYGRVGRPVNNTSDIIKVEFGLSLIQIMDVDEKNQVLETNVWYTYQWNDALLTWDPADFDGLVKIMVPPENVWIPDIVLYNFADERLNEQRRALVVVEHTGAIIWMPQAILRSSCKFETRFFPFDTQSCYLQFGSWTHDGTKLDLQFFNKVERFMVDDYIPGNEWDVTLNKGERNVKIYECCKDVPYLDLKFHLRLRRKVAFYSFILILPCALLSCLTLVIFWVPPESPAKLSLGMNIFVAFFVLLLLLSESTPKAAESIPLIGAYFCLSMVMITMSTALATVIANMFFRGVRINRAPRWLRALMIDGIARVLCLRESLLEKDADKRIWSAKPSNATANNCAYADAKVRLLDNGRRDQHPNNVTVGVSSCGEMLDQNSFHNTQDVAISSGLADDVRAIREVLDRYKETNARAEKKEKCVREWKVICCVTDRLFFISYVIINAVGIIVIFFGQIA